MKTFECQCGSRLFFHSTHCVNCDREVALCPNCCQVAALRQTEPPGSAECGNCGQPIGHCINRVKHRVCNGGVAADGDADDSVGDYCPFCALNRTIPDLSVDENLDMWRRLERAKHRVLQDCRRLGLPVADDDLPHGNPLRFEFKSAQVERVATGHAAGVITIELSEADSVKREQTRVQFGEPQRTLVGHFRHELGHFYWERLVQPQHLSAFRDRFGDETDPGYAEAKDQYYQNGPPGDWRTNYVSEYATMHPWEDFAETFNAYLDMIAVVATSRHFSRMKVEADERDFGGLIDAYREIGVVANELNRDIGLLDLVPEVFTSTVRQKMEWMHRVLLAESSKNRVSQGKTE